jgi:hypothetical protein
MHFARKPVPLPLAPLRLTRAVERDPKGMAKKENSLKTVYVTTRAHIIHAFCAFYIMRCMRTPYVFMRMRFHSARRL